MGQRVASVKRSSGGVPFPSDVLRVDPLASGLLQAPSCVVTVSPSPSEGPNTTCPAQEAGPAVRSGPWALSQAGVRDLSGTLL